MNCDRYQLQASEFVDNELDPREVRMLFVHLGSCDACWNYYRRIEHLHAAVTHTRITGDTRESPAFRGRISEVNPASSQRRLLQSRHSVSRASVLLGAYVAFVVGVLLTLLILPAREDLRQFPSDTFVPLHLQTAPRNPHTIPGGLQSSPWRRP
jgi:anti-sigma factor RsiW